MTVAITLTVLSIFSELYPRLMISTTNSAYNLTIRNTASPGYPLRVMTIVVVIALPAVLAYTAWTYYVFRRRLKEQR
jgi:cytochrome bd ubiquinol oxidase subunit II